MSHTFVRRLTLFVVAVCGLSNAGDAQTPAAARSRITGRVLDPQGAGMSDVGIQVVGTTIGALSGVDGRYTVVGVPAGTVTLLARRIGYGSKTITGIVVAAGQTVEQNIAMAPAALQLATATVTATQERGSVSAALDRQRSAVAIINTVTAEQISKSPDADAAAAVGRVSGVNVQDGKYVFVRGLGDRYTTSSLNGARLPSPEPERKVVPLDLFPASLIQSVTTSKTFTPDQPGDFAGAAVNIQTKEFPARRTLVMSSSAGYNAAISGKSTITAGNAGLDYFAFGGDKRQLPTIIRDQGSFNPQPGQGLVNSLLGTFRNRWSARPSTGSGNGSFGMSVGGNDPILGQRIGYLLSGNYSVQQNIKRDQVRAYAAARQGIEEVDRFEGTSAGTGVLWGGLANFSTYLGRNTKLSLNNTYNRTSDNDARVESGISENLGLDLDITRLQYVERMIRSSQLKAEHSLFGGAHEFDWSATASGVTRREPDRSEIVYSRVGAAAPEWLAIGTESAVRTFGDLNENTYEGAANYRMTFFEPGKELKVKFGGLYRSTSRDAENFVYSAQGLGLDNADRRLAPEEIFDGRFTQPGENALSLVPLSQGGSYTAEDRLAAGYLMFNWQLRENVNVITGARYEASSVEVIGTPTLGAPIRTNPKFNDVLPSLAITYKATENQNLRFSVSQTVARPEYRELAPLRFRDVLGGDNVEGNANLIRSLVRNVDLRWEWFPSRSEVLSVSLFGKQFDNPIERIYLATSGTRVVTFQNAKSATNYGIELEARTALTKLSPSLENVTIFSNATIMQSEITLRQGLTSTTNANRAMVGQAPYMVNGGVTWNTSSGSTSATLLYNVIGARIVDAGVVPLPDVKELPRNVLDLSLRFPVVRGLAGRIDARNLLDAQYRTKQGLVTRESYYTGRLFSFGLNWQP
ncbi:MAG: TonB-dependent receptor [Gemmatimonadaceae bacterium]|nr:TonB-dependent receptor [Gemmatimonadaceae bacterium]